MNASLTRGQLFSGQGWLQPWAQPKLAELPTAGYWVPTVSVNEKREKGRMREREREAWRWKRAEVRQVPATLEYSNSPTSLTPTNRTMRFQFITKKRIPPQFCKHCSWPCFRGRTVAKGRTFPSLPLHKLDLSHLIISSLSPQAGWGWAVDQSPLVL